VNDPEPICEQCAELGIEEHSNAIWIVHTSAEEAIRHNVPKASMEDCEKALKHMVLAGDKRVTLRKKIEARLRKFLKQKPAEATPGLPSPTSRETWKALGPEEQWTLFSRVEMDAIGWERRVRQLKDELARQVAASKAFADRVDREDQQRLRLDREHLAAKLLLDIVASGRMISIKQYATKQFMVGDSIRSSLGDSLATATALTFLKSKNLVKE
jgi:hypothetical protein